MTRRLLILTAVCLTFACSSAPESGDVLRLHAEARGGAAAIERVRSVEVRVTLEEDWVLEGHYRATRDGEMRIDVFAGEERVFTEAVHEGRGWAMQKNETTGSPITQLETDVLRRGILGNVYGLHELEVEGVDVSVSGPEEIDGESFWLVDLTYADDFAARYYLDAETYLIARQRSDHALHPAVDMEVRRFESRYSDYREVEGVLFSFLTEKFDLDTGERVQRDTVHSVAVNEIDDRSVFRMPE